MADYITRYDSPAFSGLKEAHYVGVSQNVSAVAFAHFRTRNKAIVRYVNVRLQSACSAAAGTVCVVRVINHPSNTSAQTLATMTMVSATSAGTIWTYTLTTNNTVTSIHDAIYLYSTGCDKGKFGVVYEYNLIPPITL